MKNKIIKFLLVCLLLSIVYYVATITLTNHGQFVNYYHYPSNSISESKEYSNFLRIVPKKNVIIVEGDEEFKKFIENDLNLWFDKFKVNKSFGLLNLFSYNTINEKNFFLRIGYKDSDKNHSLSYDELTWLAIQNNEIKSVSNTYGMPSKIGSTVTLKFYEDKKKKKPLGALEVLIDK
ncbi:hypothetical protein [Tenacibaculum discolor]|uniref:Lipoprotein n=1 Tax=Tenacibaculum discolor TaxID=361581 RepID=A0ABT9F0B5_9FLAO|nr:hypothetical protein [Tenacibaculum discolor]MDP2540149.1 hypothetical protein [Tenacibaculum discolor]PHO01223.1 hypothetical protein CSC82_24735 [Rhodobacteraceae bacterium 4F10]